jgi:hypothetical protein
MTEHLVEMVQYLIPILTLLLVARGTQAQNFLHNINFGHNVTIKVLCTTFEQNPSILIEIWHIKVFEKIFLTYFKIIFANDFGFILHLCQKEV